MPMRPIRRGDVVQLDPNGSEFGLLCFVVEAVREDGTLDLVHMTITPRPTLSGGMEMIKTLHSLVKVPVERCELVGEAAWLYERAPGDRALAPGAYDAAEVQVTPLRSRTTH